MKKIINRIILILSGIFVVLSILCYIQTGTAGWLTRSVWIVTALLLGGVVALNFGLWKEKVLSSRTATGATRILQLVIVLAIGVFVYLLSDQFFWKLDLTGSGLYRLSDETKEAIKNVTNDTKILLFSSPEVEASEVKPLVEYVVSLSKTYAARNSHLKFEKVNPTLDRALALEYNIQKPGTVVFDSGGNRIAVEMPRMFEQNQNDGRLVYRGEIEFTRALKSLRDSRPRIVYFLTGHGEVNPGDKSESGYAGIANRMRQENIQLQVLDLLKMPEIPANCSLLIVGAPRKQLSLQEMDQIDRYIAGGGNVLALLEYDTDITVAESLLQMGLFFIPNLAVEDQDYNPQLGRVTIEPSLVSGEITKPLMRNRLGLLMPTGCGLQVLPEEHRVSKDKYVIEPLLRTSRNSYGEVNMKEIRSREVSQDKKDLSGPLVIAYSVKRQMQEIYTNESGVETNTFEARMVAVGDSDFANNTYFEKYGNSDFFLNAVNYLLRRESDITMRPKDSGMPSYQLTSSERRVLIVLSIFWVIAYLVPQAIRLAARRRKVKS